MDRHWSKGSGSAWSGKPRYGPAGYQMGRRKLAEVMCGGGQLLA